MHTRISCIKLAALGMYVPFFSSTSFSKVTLIMGSKDVLLENLASIGKVFILCEDTALGKELFSTLVSNDAISCAPKNIDEDLMFALPLRINTSSKVSKPTLNSLCKLLYLECPNNLTTLFPCDSSYIVTSKELEGTTEVTCSSFIHACPMFMDYLAGKCSLGCASCQTRTRVEEEHLYELCNVSL